MQHGSKNKPNAGITAYSIGQKLKRLRTEKGLTLNRVGAEVGLSTALLSKLESETMIPTLPTLLKISRAYGVDLRYFFSTVTQHSLAITRNAHIRDDHREHPNAKQIPLHRPTPESKQISRIVDIPARASFNLIEGGTRTQVTAYVVEGALHMKAEGVEDVLHTGDCIVMDTEAEVQWWTADSRCRVLAVFAP